LGRCASVARSAVWGRSARRWLLASREGVRHARGARWATQAYFSRTAREIGPSSRSKWRERHRRRPTVLVGGRPATTIQDACMTKLPPVGRFVVSATQIVVPVRSPAPTRRSSRSARRTSAMRPAAARTPTCPSHGDRPSLSLNASNKRQARHKQTALRTTPAPARKAGTCGNQRLDPPRVDEQRPEELQLAG
jgi:hypothetical protein